MNFLRNIIKGSNRLFGEKTKKIAIVSIALVLIVSYGLFFYLQTITENDIKNSLIQQQRQRQIESTKAISQNIGSTHRWQMIITNESKATTATRPKKDFSSR
jgi:hypothetical protein